MIIGYLKQLDTCLGQRTKCLDYLVIGYVNEKTERLIPLLKVNIICKNERFEMMKKQESVLVRDDIMTFTSVFPCIMRHLQAYA